MYGCLGIERSYCKTSVGAIRISNTVEEEQNVTVGAEKKRKRLGRKW